MLARPFQRLEGAIEALGENRAEGPIDIRGPTDVRSVGQRLEWLRQRLAELEADKARALRHVSHELKTPLAALREGVALLQDGVTGELTEGQREVAGILQQNTLALQRQIEALLGLNAAAFEAQRLRRRPTELLPLLQQLADAQRLQRQAQGITVRIEGEPVVVQADADRLGTAFANVLSNAIRFSPPGGTVGVRVAREAASVRIEISDQGPGIAEADLAHVFDPFYRGQRQPRGAVPGTGVGLSIVREYVLAHGGQVGLSSDAGGTVLRIELPA